MPSTKMNPSRLCDALTRRKDLQHVSLETKLNRCLNTFDLTLLGVGLMIGAGIYVLTGTIIRVYAGPAAILSFFLAGMASLLSALCFAEFGSRVPKAGSSYVYTYVTMGEFWAFFVGWNIILEYVILISAVSVGFSGSVNFLCNGCIQNWTVTYVGQFSGNPSLAAYPDFLALAIIVVLSLVVACGVKYSTGFTNVLTCINISVLVLIAIAGFVKGAPENLVNAQHGGFMPYGFNGVLHGAAAAFSVFLGFDGISIAGEEAKNPSRTIPLANCISIGLVLILYMGATTALTLMMPYQSIDIISPFPVAFDFVGLHWVKVVVSVGSLVGIVCNILTHVFSMPRVVYSMADDGLIFRSLAYVNSKTQTPLLAIVITCLFAGIMALLFNIEALIEFFSIGTLIAYTFVAASIILLRYQHPQPNEETHLLSDDSKLSDCTIDIQQSCNLKPRFKDMECLSFLRTIPTERVTLGVLLIVTLSEIILAVCLIFGVTSPNMAIKVTTCVVCGVSGGTILAGLLVLCMYEQYTDEKAFSAPLVPFLPAASMLANIVLILELNWLTWIRLLVWMAIGFSIYFLYGIRHSSENKENLTSIPLKTNSSEAYGTTTNANDPKPPTEKQ